MVCKGFAIAVIAALSSCSSEEKRNDSESIGTEPSQQPVPADVKGALDTISALDGEVEVRVIEGSFLIEPHTYFCSHNPVVDNHPLYSDFSLIAVAGIEKRLRQIGQSPHYDTATRVVPDAHRKCSLPGAVHSQAFLMLHESRRPYRAAVKIWQGNSRVIAVSGRDLDPEDPQSWGDLPYRKGGPRFEDVVIPAIEVLSDKALGQVFANRQHID